MTAVLIVCGVLVGFALGYLVATARTPVTVARMSDAELRSLARRVSRRRLAGLAVQHRAAKAAAPVPSDAKPDELAEARKAALAFVDQTRAGGEPQ